MKYILHILLISILVHFYSCTKPVGCIDNKAYNFDPNAAVANASCLYPELYLYIDLKIDSQDFEINRIYNINGCNTAFKQFQFYLSSVVIDKSDNDSLSYPQFFPLVKETQQLFYLSEVDIESYSAIRFNIGLPAPVNSQIVTFLNDNSHPLCLQSPDTMHLSYSEGYIFLKMVGKVDRNGDGIPNENESFDLKIGTNQLLRSVQLEIDKNITKARDTIYLSMNVQQLLQGVDLPVESYTQSTNNVSLAIKIADNIPAAFTEK